MLIFLFIYFDIFVYLFLHLSSIDKIIHWDWAVHWDISLEIILLLTKVI